MATALSLTPPDFATAMDIYELGKNAPGRNGAMRTLKGAPPAAAARAALPCAAHRLPTPTRLPRPARRRRHACRALPAP